MRTVLEDADVERIALRIADLMAQQEGSPWLNSEGAAEYMACPISRIRKLTMTDELPSYKEGGRRLYKRSEIDAFIASGGGSTS